VFTTADLVPGKDRVVILSDAFWRSRFRADPAVLGQVVRVDGFPCAIVGILPPGFRLIVPRIGEQPSLYEPISVLASGPLRMNFAFAIGRLKPGLTLQAARAEMGAIVSRLPPDESHGPGKRGVNVVPLDEEVASGIRPALLILFAAAACVLLIACGNIAGLILAATGAREGELALRTALGAQRRRLARQLLTESTALSVAGAALGLALSWWAVRGIVHLYPERIPRLDSLRPEPAVFAFTALLALTTAVLFGGLPACRYSRSDVRQVLQASAAGGRQIGSMFRNVLMAAQIAAALVLLIGAGLLLRSFLLMHAIDPGYRRHNLLAAHLMLDDNTYAQPDKQAAFVQRLLDRIGTLPGVEAAGATNSLPLDFNFLMGVTLGIEGHPELGKDVQIDCRSVTPYFLEAMGIGLVAGRYLQPADSAVGGAVLVNRAFAKQYYGDTNPVGRHLFFGAETRTIAGVVADIKDLGLDRKTMPAIYMPFDRQPTSFVDLAVRTAADPRLLVNAVRAELRAIDPNQPLGEVTTMEDILQKAVAKPRWYAILIGSFAGLALLLASVGIYGVVTYAVSRRTHEIGIRMAIGVQPADVLRMVLLRGMGPAWPWDCRLQRWRARCWRVSYMESSRWTFALTGQ
jgi:putative ABC transport system permease protein